MSSAKFSTLSTNIVAFLLMNEIEPDDMVKSANNTYFFYERTQKLQDSLEEYNEDVRLKKFISCFKRVKEMTRK